ncbi:hypothetical protein DFR86_00920 [Acidianus sulfidivorans JP7]|uniref:Uncharacterized protein n=1 Tax=Acidianus sulfidivorans JP7 TaxID=619593 RepID=A0A2U9IJZ7_9CREN|nr:hypothetical protein [Acidianus sulfidivorans]AWR96244.1 hypothetical protein DFR86_00920 [Acidianus sulfidivorans JP7]
MRVLVLYWLVDKINVSNTSELIVSFTGKIVGTFTYNPGIVLYSSNFSLTQVDGQPRTYEILTAWSAILWLDKLNGWHSVLYGLPSFTSGSYTVIFKNVNSSVIVYEVIINSSTYPINYNTGIPWNSIGYVGVRPDTDTVLPLSFIVKGALTNVTYNVYLNGKLFSTGITNGTVTLPLRVFSPTIVNITFPQYHVYKVIYISPSQDANIREDFPTLQVSLAVIWKERRK